MGLFPNNETRLIGISIVVGIVMTMVYDVVQTGIEKGLVMEVSIKIIACLIAIFIGIGLYYFDRTHNRIWSLHNTQVTLAQV
jgi:protein-S-isoprenylcysteine O-methyltransferase Ste14